MVRTDESPARRWARGRPIRGTARFSPVDAGHVQEVVSTSRVSFEFAGSIISRPCSKAELSGVTLRISSRVLLKGASGFLKLVGERREKLVLADVDRGLAFGFEGGR